MLVRNNLTGIELVTFAGESVLGEFKFGKFRHDHHSSKGVEEERESAILEFDMKEKHLKDCDRKYQFIIILEYIFQFCKRNIQCLWIAFNIVCIFSFILFSKEGISFYLSTQISLPKLISLKY